MDLQPKFIPQSENPLFADRRSNQLPVAGTVARETLESDPVFYEGKNPDGSFVTHNPRPITLDLLRRGQDRFNIYCGPCHDRAGTGKGLVTASKLNPAFPPPPSFHDDRIRSMPDGEIFNTVSGGIRTMPSYRHQMPAEDRWAAIAYLRALERSRHGALADLSSDELEQLK